MKKKLTVCMMAAALSVSMLAGCQEKPAATEAAKAETTAAATTAAATEAAKTEAAKTETTATAEAEYQFVSAEDAVKAAQGEEIHVLDVREWANYTAGRVVNSDWCPIFPLEDESLVDKMKAYADKNLKDGKEIYLICNSGKRGAQKATAVLSDAGIDASLIYTVEGGAKALADVKDALTTNRTEEKIDWKYAKAEDVLKEEGAQIVDVRDEKTYGEGHLKDSLNCGLKEIEDPKAQTAMYELAAGLDAAKPVYLLCYSGNKCAKTGISILKDAGFDVNNVFIIENGAKDEKIQAAFVK